MANFAPYAECNCGTLTWQPDADSAVLLQSQTAGWGTVLEAATSDDITSIWAVLCASFNPPNALALEVFDITDGFPDLSDLTETAYYPGSDLANGNIQAYGRGPYNAYGPTQTDVWQAIVNTVMSSGTLQMSDDAASWPVDNDAFILNNSRGDGYTYFFQVDGISGQHAGQWITRLRHYWWVQRFSTGDDKASVSVQSMIRIAGNTYPGDTATHSDEIAGGHLVITDWYNDPSTGLPWTPNVVDRFDTLEGYDYGFGFQATGTGAGTVSPLIFQSHVVVEAAPDDQRLAVGVMQAQTKLQGWRHVAIFDPGDSLSPATVALTAGNKYLWLWRLTRYQTGTGFGMALCRLDEPGVTLPGPPLWTSMNVPLNRQTHRLSGLGEEQSTVGGMLLQTGAVTPVASFSADSQPYAETAPTGLDTPNGWPDINEFFELSAVDEYHSFHQLFTPTTTTDYGWFRVNVCTAVGTVEDDLRILVYRVADGAHMAPIIRVAQDDLAQPNTQWQQYEVRIDDVALVAGTQYGYAVWSSTSHRQGWLVQVVNGGNVDGAPGGPPLPAWDTLWGGAASPVDSFIAYNTQMQDPDPGTVWPATGELSLSTIPDGPGYFDAFAGADVCELQPVTVMWSSPVLPDACGGFAATEIERSDDGGATFWPICHITDVSVGEFTDYEWKPVPSPIYRARSFRGDGVPSDYTEEIEVEMAFGVNVCGSWFTSNEQPDLNVFYPDVGEGSIPPRPYTFPVERNVYTPHNRDLSIVYTGLEDRGSLWSALVRVRSGIVNTAGVPCVADSCADYELEGVDVFGPLLEIARADLSYVCVRNEHGNRWYANVHVPTAKWRVTGEVFTADIEIVPVTDIPSRPDATASS